MRKVENYPMHDEPEPGKLQMNPIQHEEPGSVRLERDGRVALEQPESDMENGKQRGEVHTDRIRAAGPALRQTRQDEKGVGAALPAESDRDQPCPIDTPDRPMDGRSQDYPTNSRAAALRG